MRLCFFCLIIAFISAPLLVPFSNEQSSAIEEEQGASDQRGWWFTKENPDSFHSRDDSDICKGFDQSMLLVKDTFENEGPFDGLMGFSQGAAFVTLLCGLKEQNRLDLDFKFAIIIAGFSSLVSSHSHIYQQAIACPSLHVFGETDRIIPKEMSEELLKHFTNYETLIHPGGHYTPATGPQKEKYIKFLTGMQEMCCKKAVHE